MGSDPFCCRRLGHRALPKMAARNANGAPPGVADSNGRHDRDLWICRIWPSDHKDSGAIPSRSTGIRRPCSDRRLAGKAIFSRTVKCKNPARFAGFCIYAVDQQRQATGTSESRDSRPLHPLLIAP